MDEGVKHPVMCPILPNHSTQKDGKCKRFHLCRTQGRDKEDGCPARGQA